VRVEWIVCAILAGGCSRAAPDLHRELERLDMRAPEMLTPEAAWQQKQKMMGFLTEIQQVTEGPAVEDWDAVMRAAATLGTSPETRLTCSDRPRGVDAIGAMAIDFRCRADEITAAAQAHDRGAVLRATAKTLGACNGCHVAFREQLVDEATWRAARSR
jgi:hypothetical protein